MTALAIIGGLSLVLLAPLVVAALRQRTLLIMASRNINRRRSEALLIVGGALLGTAIITSSLVVGDVIEGSLTDAARTRYGPIDITVTPADRADLGIVAAAVEGAAVEGIDGLLTATTTTATIEAPGGNVAVPEVRILEVDITAARKFGPDPRITGISDSSALGRGEVLINEGTAQRLGVQAGARLRLHAHGSAVDVTVTEVVAEIGLAGYGGAVVAPGTIAGMVGTEAVAAAPPRAHLLVSLDGGVFDTRDLSNVVVADLRAAVADLSGVVVEGEKAAVLEAAERDGSEFTGLFTVIGSFSVLAGILLLVNLFVMLAEERKTELGMLRAVGFTRRRLARAFAIEATMYALVASAVGAVVGVGIGWLVAVLAGAIFGVAEPGTGYRLVIEPASLAIGATTGLAISLVTVWATSVRIARLNIIRAIRDLPEPRLSRMRLRTLVLGGAGILGGAALATVGYLDEHAVPLLLGVPVAAFAASPLVRRLLPDRTARILTSTVVLAWALAVTPLFPGIMGTSDEVLFVLQAVVLTAGAVSLAGSLDRVWSAAIERLGRGGLAPRLGVAYPLARPFRTSMLLGMFSLVILTVALLAAMSATFERNTSAAAEQAAGGFDILVDTNPANPIDTAALRAHAGVTAVAGLARGTADFDAAYTAGTRAWPITGIDADLLDRGTPGLLRRGEAYSSDAAAFRAVLDDPALAIVSDVFLTDGQNGTGLDVGDSFAMIDPASGRPHELTIAAVNEDWLGNGVIVSREVTAALLGGHDTVSRTYVAVADGADPENVAAALNATFLAHGADAHTFGALMSAAMRQMTSLLSLLQGFLGLGLLIGIAGLGVVMIRAVRERRQEIGMLRAMGCRAGLVRTVMLSEAGLIAAQGTVIGAVLGLITARQLLVHTFGDIQMPFVVPWPALLVIVTLPLAAAMAATAWPASRAAAIRPAVALRVTD